MQFIKRKPIFVKLFLALFYASFLVLINGINPLFSQYSSQDYANYNPVNWRVSQTEHFKIVYDMQAESTVRRLKPIVEKLYKAYKNLLGVEPENKIVLYLNRDKLILSRLSALNSGDLNSIWHKNPFFNCFKGSLPEWQYLLRYEIANVFQQAAQSSKLGLLQAFLLSRPSVPLWSVGLPLYLSVPRLTPCDTKHLYDYWNVARRAKQAKGKEELKISVLGRSQVDFYNKIFSADLLSRLYDVHKSFLGISYFDFDYAFLKTFSVPYAFFFNQWKRQQFEIYNDTLTLASNNTQKGREADERKALQNEIPAASSSITNSKTYHSFYNIQLSLPIVLPYYLNTSDYGLGGIVRWKSPLRLHKFQFAGILSFPDVANQSLFYTSYVNNRFGPRIKLSFKHYTSKSDWLDLSVQKSNVLALSSLWKIDGSQNPNSNWYTGFMFRYLNVRYYDLQNLPRDVPIIAFDNRLTRQTDLRFVLANRMLKPTSFNAVHPLKGHGFRASVTGSAGFINDETKYARFYGEAFTLVPIAGKQRIYLYAAGAFDAGETMGADYLYFSDEADYELPEPKLLGSTGRAVEGFIRGYKNSIAGEYFAWGSVEYRIPLLLDPGNLLGVLPLPKMAVALFTDGGVIGEARTLNRKNFTAYRMSMGAELKTAIRFGGFNFAFKVGMAQALNRPFGPVLFFSIQPAIPF